jgi:hypothetical protein
MKHKAINIFLLLVSSFLLFTGIAAAQDFSADLISKSKEQVFRGKIFFAKEKVRMETGETITITRLDKNMMWMLMPTENMYMEMPLGSGNIVAGAEKIRGEIERKFLGKESVDGKTADKYRIVYISGNQKAVVLTWIVSGLNVPIKTAAEDGSWSMEYKNIKTGKQSERLFEIPPGYKKFSYPMPSLSNMGNYTK